VIADSKLASFFIYGFGCFGFDSVWNPYYTCRDGWNFNSVRSTL